MTASDPIVGARLGRRTPTVATRAVPLDFLRSTRETRDAETGAGVYDPVL